MTSDIKPKSNSHEPGAIARAELARWRGRLGKLSPEQEQRIETLVTSTAIKVSLLGGNFLNSLVTGSVSQSSLVEINLH